MRWIRHLLTGLAAEGRTVFLSSHLMSEMAQTADHVIVVGGGRLLRDQPMSEFIADAAADVVRVRSPQANELAGLLQRCAVVRPVAGGLEIEGLSSDEVGIAAAGAGITLLELSTTGASLEEAYMALTEDAVTYHAGSTTHPTEEKAA